MGIQFKSLQKPNRWEWEYLRRFVALLIAFALGLCGVCAGAESPTALPGEASTGWRLSNDITVDLAAYQSLMETLCPDPILLQQAKKTGILLNAVDPSLILLDDGIQLDIDLKGKRGLSVGGVRSEDGITFASTLLPSYVITIPIQNIIAIVTAVASMFLPARQPASEVAVDSAPPARETGTIAPASRLKPIVAKAVTSPVLDRLSKCVVTSEPEYGVFRANGSTYDVRQSCNISGPNLHGAWESFVDWAFENKGIISMAEAANKAGLEITAENAKALMPENILPQFSATTYSHSLSDGSFTTATFTNADGSKVYADARVEITRDTATAVLRLPTKDLEANLAMRQGDELWFMLDLRGREPLFHGEFNVTAETLNGRLDMPTMQSDASLALNQIDDALNGQLDINTGGTYVGVTFDSRPFDEVAGDGLILTADLYYGAGAAPLIHEVFTMEPASTLTLDYTNAHKTLVPITSLVTGAGGYLPGLLTDLLVNGLGGLILTLNTTIPGVIQPPRLRR